MGNRVWATAPLAASAAALCISSVCLLSLAACDGAPSATPARAHADGSDRRLADSAPAGEDSRGPARYSNAVYTTAPSAARRDDGARAADTPLFHGKPLWAANKKHSAQENADYHFKRDGEALGATSEEDFLSKVHAFVDNPPKGVETLTRSNGDKLMYDPKANLFAVVDKDGAPRTLFKPRDGTAYWAKQKDSVAQSDQDRGDDRSATRSKSSRRSARRSAGDDNG
jgi:pyocin large subunit-like protein